MPAPLRFCENLRIRHAQAQSDNGLTDRYHRLHIDVVRPGYPSSDPNRLRRMGQDEAKGL